MSRSGLTLIFASSLIACTANAGKTTPPVNPYAKGAFPIRIAATEGLCLYWNTDVGLNSAELARHFKDSDKSLLIEFWYESNVPEECIAEGVRAMIAIGFTRVYIRPRTDQDFISGPPR